MLTIFSTPKPFHGHIGVIQRNAIQSWKHLDPQCEVILFGDEDGAASAAKEFGVRHEPEVERAEAGTKYLRYFFSRAQQIAKHDILCYVNCDIILPSSFWRAVKQTMSLKKPFLMIGQRWDTNITEPLNFEDPAWGQNAVALAMSHGKGKGYWFADYFVFTRGLYTNMPPLVLGRYYWDSWMVWRARTTRGVAVVNASDAVVAIHQNHDYSYHPAGFQGTVSDRLAQRNHAIAGNGRKVYPMYMATHNVGRRGVVRHWMGITPLPQARLFLLPKLLRIWYHGIWFPFLWLTRPIRRVLGVDDQWKQALKNKFRSIWPRREAITLRR